MAGNMLRLAAAAVAAAAAAVPASSAASARGASTATTATPNVLFIAVDDLRPEHGVYGGRALTPNIDKFAASATVFTRNYVQIGVCSPSRTSMLTGLYPDSTHVTDLFAYFRSVGANVTTLPQAFKDAGHFTAGAGKIFHPGHASGAGLYPDGGCPGCGGYNDPPSWTEYLIPPANALPPWNITYGNSSVPVPDSVPDSDHPDGQTAAWAVAQLKALAASGQPFFLAPGFYKPHLPWIAPQRFFDLYANYSELAADHAPAVQEAPLSWTGWSEVSLYADVAATIASHHINLSHPCDAMPPAKAVEMRRGYFAATSFNDAQVGLVLDALEASGLAGSTTVVLFGDHGWQLGDHGDWGKHTNFEDVTRAPLIIRAPAYPQAAGKVVTRAFSSHIDVFPTLLELAGLAFPGQAALQGVSLVPVLANPDLPSLPGRPFAYSQYPRFQQACPGTECAWPHAMGYTVRTPEWRFTIWTGYDNSTYTPNWNPKTSRVFQTELYSHAGDANGTDWEAFENANLAGDPAYAAVVANLSAVLQSGPNLLHPQRS